MSEAAHIALDNFELSFQFRSEKPSLSQFCFKLNRLRHRRCIPGVHTPFLSFKVSNDFLQVNDAFMQAAELLLLCSCLLLRFVKALTDFIFLSLFLSEHLIKFFLLYALHRP